MADKIVATNRQARYNYAIIETFEAGIELKGPEVKSIRAGRVNLRDSFALCDNREIYLYNCHISPYEKTTAYPLDPVRKRKLLMHKTEIMRLLGKTSQKGLTLVPLKLYFKKGLCKIELALAQGKREYDKRDKIRKKETLRELKKLRETQKRRG